MNACIITFPSVSIALAVISRDTVLQEFPQNFQALEVNNNACDVSQGNPPNIRPG